MTRFIRRLLAAVGLAAIALLVVVTAPAASVPLQIGAAAPQFRTIAALGGKTFEFDLAAALRKGPVVLYFFPKAFTHGCTIEARAFADATPHFAALGATVIGISHDDIDTLKRFSTEACRDKFAVGSDPKARTIHAYGAASLLPGMASRISYVIGQDDKVVFVHEGSDPLRHVAETLAAVRRLAPAAR
ncbi:MAG: Alkyl hydroperoxide reductase subunit C-like protein [Burkholderiaceae bacterium]|jgi:peroxiredoxin|nr:MAG: Alkyl hydroperoxide reductase subunit C-like protein [Burkholderiaceae bacterium]